MAKMQSSLQSSLRVIFVCVIALIHPRAARPDAIQYSVTTLPDLPGSTGSIATALNNHGMVVGISFGGGAPGFLYSNGQTSPVQIEAPTGINDSGQIVGAAPTFVARAINNAGQIVGNGATLLSDGVQTDLGALAPGHTSLALAINSAGQIVGRSGTSSGEVHPFLYSNGAMIDILPQATGQLWEARALNDVGQVVGGPVNAYGQAFLYDSRSNKTAFLGTLAGLGSEAYGINLSGEIVGASYATLHDLSSLHAFIFRNGNMVDLNQLIPPDTGFTLREAVAINDRGQIAANAFVGGREVAVLLTPLPTPEPATFVVVGVGSLALVSRRKRRITLGRRAD
jgi:probable HAF family extracellular repeat protein